MNIKDKLYQLFSIRWIQHLAFWSVFLLLEIGRFFDMPAERIANELLFEITQLSLIALFVYVNLRHLIPKYWNNGDYLKYIGSLIVWEIIIIAILSITINFYPDIQFQKIAARNPLKTVLLNFFRTNIFVFSSSLFHFVKEWIRLKDENLKYTQKAQEQLEAEISLLKAQVNPHFLFNTLNNIYSMSLYDSHKTPEMILKLSQLISYILYECKDQEVSLEKEIQFIKNYIELESIRVEDVAIINYSVSGEEYQHKIPPLLFLPLVENVFKHGISSESGHSTINIDFKITQNNIELCMSNPIDDSKTNREDKVKSGLGVENVKKRLQLLFPKQHSLLLTETNKEYRTNLLLTLKSEP